MWGWQPAEPPSGCGTVAGGRYPVLGTVPPLHELWQAWLSLAASHHSRKPVSPEEAAGSAPPHPPWVRTKHSRARREGVPCCPGCSGVQHIPEGRCHARTPYAPCQLPTHAHPGAIKLSQVSSAAPLHRFPPLTRRHGMPGAMSCRGGGVGRLLPSRRARCPVLSEKLWGRGPCTSSSSSALLKRW